MIIGAHSIIYSSDPEADRTFFRDVLKFRYVDVDHGWLIFALPPSEVAIHPAEISGAHELYLMCDDVQAFVESMQARNECGFRRPQLSDNVPNQTLGKWVKLYGPILPLKI